MIQASNYPLHYEWVEGSELSKKGIGIQDVVELSTQKIDPKGRTIVFTKNILGGNQSVTLQHRGGLK